MTANDRIVRAKPSLLFISPVIPKLTGTGIAMRAGLHVQELASSFEVTLAVLLDGQPEDEAIGEIPAELSALCAEICVVSKRPAIGRLAAMWSSSRARNIASKIFRVPPGFQRRAAAKELARRLSGRHYAAIHCFRLITGPALSFLRARGCRCDCAVLDMDDYESRTKRRYADTLLRAQGALQFLVGRREARVWGALEDRLIPKFDRVYVCSEMDRGLLGKRFPASHFLVVPNVVDPPAFAPATPANPFTFLFVGSLGYPPNRDAALFLCTDILPILRQITTQPFRVQIVGAQPDATLKKLDNGGDIEMVGPVPDLAPYYGKAGAAVAPLRAGGGTRIKILEAFSYALPVISTCIGAEGLEVSDQDNILLADTPQAFAMECRKLLEDPILRRQIGEAGHSLFQHRYTRARLATALERAYTAAQPVQAE